MARGHSTCKTDNESNIARLVTLPKLEIDQFNGDPQMYLSFCAIFDEAVDSVADNDKIKLTRLLQFTTGEAHEAIRSCVLMGGNEGYAEARVILKKRFGANHLISERIIRDLTGGCFAKTPAQLQKLADAAANAERVLHSLNQLVEVNSQQTITSVVEKLPAYIKNKWKRQATKMKRRDGRYPNFSEVVCFLQDVADDANDPVYGDQSKTDNVKGFSTELNSQMPSATSSSPTTSRLTVHKHELKCALCGAGHKLFLCKAFKDMSAVDRKKFVLKKALCENCLLSNHSTRECKKNSVCSVPGCGGKHTRFLHVDDPAVTCQANMKSSSNCAMPIVPVDINHMYVGNALLDTASSNSFISRATVDKLGIVCTPAMYDLCTLTGNTNTISEIVSIQLTSCFTKDSITLNNVCVIDHIPVRNVSFHVDTYSHLCDLPLAEMKSDGDVNVLIGQDCAEALIPLEIRKGATGEPFATRTLFGWSLNGPISNHDILNKQVIANCITTFSKEKKHDCLWSMENYGTTESTVTLSPSENKVVALWNIQVRLVEGHPELPTPWIDEGEGMPTNITVAKHCLISTERTLQKKGLMKEYDAEIWKLLNKKYVEPHPDSDNEPDHEPDQISHSIFHMQLRRRQNKLV